MRHPVATARSADVVVIGGGCEGTSAAWHLARLGAGRVVLLERAELAGGATGRSSAIVRTHYTHEALVRMSLAARRVFECFGEIVGGDAGFRRTGFLALFGPADVAAVRANVALARGVGVDARVLLPDELRALEPRMAVDGLGAAAWEPDSGYADPHGATMGYAAAARRHGAEIRVGVTVTAIGVAGGRVRTVESTAGTFATGAVVVAAGYRTRDLLAPLGVDVPLTPVRHDIAIVGRSPGFGAIHPVVSDRAGGSYYRPEGGDLTLIGTTSPHEGHVDPDVERDRPPHQADVATLAARFTTRFPSEERAVLRGGYTGVYDCSPDLQPLLGPVAAIDGLHVACGFSGHGFKLSPVIGELIAEKLLTGKTTLVDLELFGPSRFAAGRGIASPHPYSVATHG
jgi:sarcosine oxidase subunit beta